MNKADFIHKRAVFSLLNKKIVMILVKCATTSMFVAGASVRGGQKGQFYQALS